MFISCSSSKNASKETGMSAEEQRKKNTLYTKANQGIVFLLLKREVVWEHVEVLIYKD